MKIEIIGTNYTPTQTLKNLIEKKAEKLECFFKDDTTAKFVCSQSGAKERYTLEATICPYMAMTVYSAMTMI